MNTNLIKNIKLLLDEKNIPSTVLAHMANLPFDTLHEILKGIRPPSIEELYQIACSLEVPLYRLFLPLPNFLSSWHISLEELGDMVAHNPSLRGFMVGYMAESKLRAYFLNNPNISHVYKPDDHDRTNKCDIVLTYKNQEFTFEIKSLQTNTVKPNKSGDGFIATFQCDASDRRVVTLPNGHQINTTCLKFGEFDILAINLFAFTKKWDYAFALNRDLPHATQGRSKTIIPNEDLQFLIKSSIKITLPLQEPFVDNPFILMERLLQEKQ